MASIRKRTVTWTTGTGRARTAEMYQADYYDRSGKRHRRMFDLRKDAQRWLDEQTAGLVTGQWADPQAGRETVRAYGERWLARQVLAASTEATYEIVLRNHVFPSFGEMRMDAVNRADVQSLVKEWQLSAAPSTAQGRYLVMAIMFRAAVKDRVLPTSPCIDIKLPKIPPKSSLVPISTETVRALREAIAPRYQLFVTLAAGTGMRRGEILGLTLDRISFDFGTIRIDRQLSRRPGQASRSSDCRRRPHRLEPSRSATSCCRRSSSTRGTTAPTSPGCCSPPMRATSSAPARSTTPGGSRRGRSPPTPRRTTCATTSPRSRSAVASRSRSSRRCSATSRPSRPGTPTAT